MSLRRGVLFPSKHDPEGTRLSRGRLITTLLIYEIKKGENILCRGSDGGVSILGLLIYDIIQLLWPWCPSPGNGTFLEEHSWTSIYLESLISYLTLLIITIIIIVIFKQLGLADLKGVDDSVILATWEKKKNSCMASGGKALGVRGAYIRGRVEI